MMQVHKWIASMVRVGYVKGGGTFAAMIFCVIWFLLPPGYSSSVNQVIVTLVIVAIGIWSSAKVENDWGKDSSKVVIDEVAGMAVTLLYVPGNIIFLLAGFILFRFFDIVKPLGIRYMEKLPSGWGTMADDIVAGLYSLIILQLIINFNLLHS